MIRRLRRRPTGERGSIIPLVPVLVIAFFMIGGLIVDGSRELNARGEAQAYAEEAARAGATAVDLKSDTLALDPVIAAARVQAYCATVMGTKNSPVSSCSLADPAFTDAKTCQGQTAAIVVNAVVQMRIETSLLGIVGITNLTSSGRAKARPFEGTTPGNAC